MRRLCLFAALAAGLAAPAQPPAADPYQLPDVNAKEWKAVGTSGLKVWDVKEGKGAVAKPGQNLTIHYTGWTTDGKVFDSSRKRDKKATFPLNRLIEGWKEGVPGMKVGGVRRLMIPAALAYKDRTDKPGIPPGSTLIFDIELFDAADDPFVLPDLGAKEWKDGPEGLKVWDVKTGSGQEVQAGDTVTIHYTGWTKDGQVFDSSKKPKQPGGPEGEPATFGLGGLIKGWQVGMPGMKVGGVRRLLIPWALAYGENGSPPSIPPRADLVFEIEVIKTGR